MPDSSTSAVESLPRSESVRSYVADDARREVRLLHQISEELKAPKRHLGPILKSILGHMAAFAGMQRGMVTILEPSRDLARVDVSHGLSAEQQARGKYQLGEGVIGRVIDRGEPCVVPSIGRDPVFLDRTESRNHLDRTKIAFLCVPISHGSQVIGALSVDRIYEHDLSLEEDLRLLTIIATMIGQAVRQRKDQIEEQESLKREQKRLEDKPQPVVPDLIGTSRPMRLALELLKQVAPSDATVLIRGESGTGKELVARAVHAESLRREGPFVALNCGSIPEHLVESELFGHVRGAFTGAQSNRVGWFEAANGGTLFLDEVGELSLSSQVKLLRALQTRQIDRVGEARSRPVDVRVIAATHVNLEKAIQEGRFREDLYYRINVFPIYVPALRERKTDITLLADHFLEKYAKEHARKVVRISAPAIDLMMAYHWPGNVRELENSVARAVLLTSDGVVREHHLPPSLQTGQSSGTTRPGSLQEQLMAFEREILVEAMRNANGNQSQAARALGTTARILGYRLRRHGLIE